MRGPGTSPSGPFFWTKLRLNAHGWPRLPWNRAWRADLSAYADDELDPGERARVQAQLDASPERQQWLAEIEHVQETLAALSAAELPRSFELSELQFAAARTADSEPIDERASATRAIPLRLATAGAVASLVALATVSGFDMLDNPTISTPTITRIEPTATAVTTGVAESPAAPESASASESAQAQQAATVAAAPSEQTQQSAAAAQSQQPEPTVAAAAVEEAEEEEQAAQEQAQYEQQAAMQAEQQSAEDTPPAMTAEQQEAARDPARGAVTAGISADQSQSDSADPTFSARDDQAAQADQADDARTAAASKQTQAEAAEPAPESQTDQAAETEDQPAATSDAAIEADEPDDPQPSRVVVVSTSGQADQDTRRISIPDTGQQTVHRNSGRSTDPNDWPIPARPQAAGETRAAEPGWETPVQIVLAVVAIVALLIWVFCWLVARRQAI